MPSPIAHLTAAYVAYRVAAHYAAKSEWTERATTLLLPAAATISLLPDFDSVAGLLSGDFGRYHNQGSHSLLVAGLFALGFASLMARRWPGFRVWLLLAFGCYGTHIVMDAATIGRGVMAFWPVSDDRFRLPFRLFYGLHWSQGWLSWRHVVTVLTESGFAAAVLLLCLAWGRARGGAGRS
jgi:membrane-bound metal-dependent hydrolase YbcI (DUF457 family)